MRIDVITVQPKMLEGFLSESILGRAVKKGICEINLVDLRDFGEGRWRKVDDKPYGGGPGMLMKCAPWFAAVESCLGNVGAAFLPPRNEDARRETGDARAVEDARRETGDARAVEDARRETGDARVELETGDAPVGLAPRASRALTRIIMTSPAGKTFTQRDAEFFANLAPAQPSQPSQPPQTLIFSPHLIFLCGHYEGFDARIETLATDIFSIGDFVLTGGELAAAAMVDSIVRLLPGVLGGGPAATSQESFALPRDSTLDPRSSLLLEAPQYTHPPEFRGMKVPEVLLSGDHAKIEAWRIRAARERTERLRPDLLAAPSRQ